MATTVEAADATITVSETYTLNGVDYGNTISKTYTANGNVVQRIMSIPTALTSIFNFGASDSAGTADKSNFKYFRITNLDDTNYMTLQIEDATPDTIFLKLNAGECITLFDNEYDIDQAGRTFASWKQITAIKGTSNTDAIDVEFFCVTG
jgi:hypothetical protein